MIVLTDNDVILKLAQCDLLNQLSEIIDINEKEIFIGPTAKFQLLSIRNPEKAIKRCGNEVIYNNLTTFLERAQIIPEVKNLKILEAIGKVPGIDDGEQQLLASSVEHPDSLFMTGDKRCLQAVMDNQDTLEAVHLRMINSVVTFESALLLAIKTVGFETVYEKLQRNPKPDQVLKIAIRSTRHEEMCECLFSYTRHLYDYLAFKEKLPERSPVT